MPRDDRADAAAPPRRGRAERLFGAPAAPSAPRPPRPRVHAGSSVRFAAAVVALQAAAFAAGAVVLAYLTLSDRPASVGAAVAEIVLALLLAAGLGVCAWGLARVRLWARGPVVALQVLLVLLGYAFVRQAGLPAVGVPVLAVAAVELFLLATPEARRALERRRGD